MKQWKVGDLAARTGLTVRTLHHYDRIGLLRPSERSPSGHRLYGESDVVRLQQIVSLRQLGLPLEQIAEWLDRPDSSALRVLELHIEQLRRQLDVQQTLCDRLERLAATMRQREAVSMEEFLNTIEAIQMFEKYYTPAELEQIRQRGEEVGAERIREVEAEWPRLIAEVRAELERGTDPSDPRVQKLGERWLALVNEFTGGDPSIAAKVKSMYENESGLRQQTGLDGELFAYVRRITEARGEER